MTRFLVMASSSQSFEIDLHDFAAGDEVMI